MLRGRESYGGPQQTLRTATMMFRRCLVALVLFVCQSAAFCQISTFWASQRSGRVAQHAAFDLNRLRKLKKIRPGPVPAGVPYGGRLPEKAPEPTPEELARKSYIQKIGRCQEASEARDLLQEMKEEGVPSAREVYHEILQVCANATQWQEAREVLKEMEQRHGTDHTAYHLVMDSKGPGAPENFSEELFVEMKSRGMLPTSDTYTKVIQSYTSQGNEQLARRFFRQAYRSGMLQIWTNGGVFLQLYDFPTDVALFLLRVAVIDRAGELVGRKAGKRTIHILTREPGAPPRPNEGIPESMAIQVLKDFGIKAKLEPSDFGRVRIRGEELERFGCERRGLSMRKKARAR